jgi:membrane protease YdiL (CAAX protease family)
VPGFTILLFFFLTVVAVCFIAYLVRELSDTTGELRLFRALFPPRRQRTVPWGVAAIPLVLAIYVLMSVLAQVLVLGIVPDTFDFPQEESAVTSLVADDELPEQHALTILMQKSGRNPIVILVCFLAAVVVAPLTEEFLFRVVFQGGIESTLRRGLGHNTNMSRRLPILFTALFFAAIHFRFQNETNVDHLFKLLIANMIGTLATMVVVIVIFQQFYRIRWSDIGLWDFRRIGRDALGAFLLQLTILIPIVIVISAVQTLAKTDWATSLGISGSMVDPIPLFLFALILGTLYSRTRRFASVFFLHAFFNLYSFLILLYLAW